MTPQALKLRAAHEALLDELGHLDPAVQLALHGNKDLHGRVILAHIALAEAAAYLEATANFRRIPEASGQPQEAPSPTLPAPPPGPARRPDPSPPLSAASPRPDHGPTPLPIPELPTAAQAH